MNEEKRFSLLEAHREFARITNNQVWDLLEKPAHKTIDEEEMLLAANTSLYHWLQVGTAVNAQRGHWLLSRVYIVLGRPQNAVEHALKCQEITENNPKEMQDYDLAFAQETLARAYASIGDQDKARDYLKKAEKLGQAIQDKDDKEIFAGDLNSGEWYGIK